MRKLRKCLVLLLSVAMLTSSTGMAVLAQEQVETKATEAEQAKVANEVPAVTETTGAMSDAVKSGNTTTEMTEKTEETTPDAGTDSGTDAGNNTGNTETNTGSNTGRTEDTTGKPENNTGNNGGGTGTDTGDSTGENGTDSGNTEGDGTENGDDTDDTKTEDETEDLDSEENVGLTDGDAEEIEAELTEETEEELEEEEEETEEEAEIINPATVIYNLGSKEITVGYDPEKAETSGGTYQLFDEEENYIIHLEDNAFFPYEVQFKFGDNVVVEWFDTPESTVTMDGHIFGVYTEQNDDTKISQIGVWVGDAYIAARPKAKTFTNPRISPRSLLPLDEIEVDLDLSDYYPDELRKLKISTVLSKLDPKLSGNENVVWMLPYYETSNDGDFDQIAAKPTDELELLDHMFAEDFKFVMIVGSALQLDETNTKYLVNCTIKTPSVVDAQASVLYKSVDGVRTLVTPIDSFIGYMTDGTGVHWDNTISHNEKDAEAFYIGLKLNSAYSENVIVKAYNGYFDTVDAIQTAITSGWTTDVTDKLLNSTMTEEDAGYMITPSPDNSTNNVGFTLVFEDNSGNVKGIQRVYVEIHFGISSSIAYDFYAALFEQSTGTQIDYWSSSASVQDGLTTYTIGLLANHPLDEIYRLKMIQNTSNNINITKAVEGHFNTEAEAATMPDIKDQLVVSGSIQGTGYPGNYGGEGKKFTIFAEGKVYQFIVELITRADPIPPDFNMQSARELSAVYFLPFIHDDYGYVGYQTLFYTDDVPLNSLTPYFYKPDGVNVYAGGDVGGTGTIQVSGSTKQDFSQGPVQYVTVDGETSRNYWVTFVKKQTGGAKLFVNGINGAEGTKREILFTATHDTHDIFIANIGDAPLTGLNVTLSADAQNVKLDPYWTIGGENNDELASFDTVAASYVHYAELPNVGKIRLLQDGTGEISGTLTISADGQESVVLTLTGNIGNLELTTNSIPEAVRYVPYAAQILHNNRYSWNTVRMQVISGTLPDGISLKPSGELYGVPKETGDFTFTVQMTSSDSRFSSVSKEYTLSVKDNTDTNVSDASDENYEVVQPVGTLVNGEHVVTDIADYEWISAGEFEEFVAFWLNGDKLAEGTEYTKAPGSTKITILGQTFRNKANNNGVNTIAAEFRVGGDENKELKRTAQNFVLELDAEDLIDEEPETPSNSNNSNNQSGTGNSNNQNNTGNSGSTGTQSSTSAPQPVSTNTNIPTGLGRNGDGISPEAILFWNNVIGQLQSKAAQMNGNHFTIDVLTGTKVFVPANVLENIRNAGATLALHTGQSVTFSLSSGDIPLEVLGNGIDLSSDVGKTAIPEALVKATGEGSITSKLVSMDSHANFGMKVDLHFSLGKENAGKYANLYRYNVANGRMEYLGSYQINSDGQAMFGITRGADFLLTVTTQRPNEAPIDEGSTYTVIPGDMMLSIASKLGVTIPQLRGWNPAIRDFNRIYPGQLIYY